MDICDAPVIESNPTLSCLRLGNRSSLLEIGARAFNGGSTKPLHFTMAAVNAMIIDTSNSVHIGDQEATI